MPNYTIKRNDTRPAINVVLSDAAGAINLTGAKAVHIYLRSDTKLIKTGAMEVTDAAAGKAKYVWQAGDLAVEGTYKMEFEVTWEDDSVQTIPNDGYLSLEVVADLAQPGDLE